MVIKIKAKHKPSSDLGDEKAGSTGPLGSVIEFPPSTTAKQTVNLTEDDVAEDFALEYHDSLRFDHDAGKWFEWTGMRWEMNKTPVAFHYARLLCRKHRKGDSRLASRKAAEGVECMARRDQRLAVTSDNWNKDPLLLATPGGTVELKTGLLRPADPKDFITQLTAVAPAPSGTAHPAFTKFLTEITGGDPDLQRFLQQWCGYCLTGLTTEQALVFIYGPGGNGKSVFENVLCEILADHAKAAPMETFAQSKYQSHTTDIAMLCGARLVVASETEKGQIWSEARINQLTGGDPVTARFMRQDNFTFHPKFKILMVGNHKPQLKAVNQAARRRIMIVPFLHKPDHPDHGLLGKLQHEYPAILRWMIDGCLDWLKHDLTRPDVVKKATADYFEEQDLFGLWIDECCMLGSGLKAQASALYVSWRAFAQAHGEEPGSSKEFGNMLAEQRFQKKKSGSIVYVGIQLTEQNG